MSITASPPPDGGGKTAIALFQQRASDIGLVRPNKTKQTRFIWSRETNRHKTCPTDHARIHTRVRAYVRTYTHARANIDAYTHVLQLYCIANYSTSVCYSYAHEVKIFRASKQNLP